MILFVAGEFPPIKTIGRIRSAKFVEHLVASGWDVCVLSVDAQPGVSGYFPELEREVPASATIVRAPRRTTEEMVANRLKGLFRASGSETSSEGRSLGADAPGVAASAESASGNPVKDYAIRSFKWVVRNWIDVPDDYRLWAAGAEKEARRLCQEERVDLVYTSLPPFSAARLGHVLKTELGVPWVIDYRDLWHGDVLRDWIGPLRSRFELMQERRYVSAADAVVAVSEQKTDYLRKLHDHAQVCWETLTNGFDPETYEPLLAEPRVQDDPIDFVFTGRLFKNRRGYAFAEALGQLVQGRPELREQVRVHILGGVSPEIRQRYDEILEHYGIAMMYRFAGDIPYQDAMRAQVQADYLLLIVDTGATSSGVIPGKLFEYVAARRPIFALTDPGATQEIIERGRLGSVVPAESVDECKRVLREWLDRDVPERLDADWGYLSQFERRNICRRLETLFSEVIAADRERKSRGVDK